MHPEGAQGVDHGDAAVLEQAQGRPQGAAHFAQLTDQREGARVEGLLVGGEGRLEAGVAHPHHPHVVEAQAADGQGCAVGVEGEGRALRRGPVAGVPHRRFGAGGLQVLADGDDLLVVRGTQEHDTLGHGYSPSAASAALGPACRVTGTLAVWPSRAKVTV